MDTAEASALCKEIFSETRDFEQVLERLRDLGFSKIDCIACLASSGLASLREAKEVVHMSHAWKEQRQNDEVFHQVLEDVLLPKKTEGRDTHE